MASNSISRKSKLVIGLCLLMILATAAWGLIKWVDLAINAGADDIKLSGKVVDQFGNPLAGARINYYASGEFLIAGSGFGYVFSDQSGKFAIEVHGSSLRVGNIEYPDAMYVGLLEESTGYNDMYVRGNLFWSHQRYDDMRNLQWSDYTPDNPIVFDVWVVDREVAKDNAKHIRWGKRSLRTAHDGRPYTLNFLINDRKLQITEGVSDNGNIVISCARDSMKEGSERNTWEVSLQAVNGGVQSTSDRYLNKAPESGYLPVMEVGRTFGQPDYQHGLYGQRYYFQSNNGDYYGTLFIDYQPFNMPYDFKTEQYEEQFCLISIEFKINTTGNRYLFKDKNLLGKVSNSD